MGTSRREFLQSAAALAGIAKTLPGAEAKLPTRLLGKTGERVSTLAFGSGQRFYSTRSEEDAVRFVLAALGTGSGCGSAAAWTTGSETGELDGIGTRKRTNPATPAKAAAVNHGAIDRHRAPGHQAKPPAPARCGWHPGGYPGCRARKRAPFSPASQPAGWQREASPPALGRRQRAPHHSPSQSGNSRRAGASWAVAGACQTGSPSISERS